MKGSIISGNLGDMEIFGVWRSEGIMKGWEERRRIA